MNTAVGPLEVLGVDVLCKKGHLAVTADETRFLRVRFWVYQCDDRRAVRRCNRCPVFTGTKAGFISDAEPQLVHVEFQALVDIADVNGDLLQAKVEIRSLQVKPRDVVPVERRSSHGNDYKEQSAIRCIRFLELQIGV